MNKKLAGWAASSADETEISNRVKGIVLALSGVIILLAQQFFNITLTGADVISLATGLGTVAGLLWALWGGILAIIRLFAEKRV